MAGPRETPLSIGPDEEGTSLQIRWADGVESVHLPRDLRLACPCAGCVDELSGRRTLVSAAVPADVYPLAIHYVGRYALQFVWSDGHQTGIYPFEYLRRLAEGGPPTG
jgi:ATP-binding protein involved in chromosome partitioning